MWQKGPPVWECGLWELPRLMGYKAVDDQVVRQIVLATRGKITVVASPYL